MTTTKLYPSFQTHLEKLEEKGLVRHIYKEINKDTELHPLVRWQFRGGIPESERKVFVFHNVTDSNGRKYEMPVVVGGLSVNREVYSIGMGVEVEDIGKKWAEARANPIDPVVVEEAACQEVVYIEDELDVEGQGLEHIPVPISTPGFDNAPYTTCSQYISVDPENGIQNMGTYRAQIKGSRRLGMNPSIEMGQGIYQHWLKYKKMGKPMPAALVIGGPPAVSYCSVQKLPYNTDEFSVAGALLGEPLRVVKAKTVDLLVPADAEIVIEGYVPTDSLEPEGPFGESHGHVNLQEFNPYMNVTAITRKKKANFVSIISQVTPSESSLIKKVAFEPVFLDHLKNHLRISSVQKVVMHEPLTNLRKLVIVQMKNPTETDVWRALTGAAAFMPAVGKMVVAVSDDINPENSDAIFWSMAYRMNIVKDVQILHGRDPGHGPRTSGAERGDDAVDGTLLMNATKKEDLPPLSLPKKEYMERAKDIWEELELPTLRPEWPWHGFSMGDWDEFNEKMAERAVRGEYFETGAEQVNQRVGPEWINKDTKWYKEEQE
ncbi:UbiD family decarboxylase [Alkalihalobacillus oceani]|uniref:UbiD family decarboxylase n=1 Tax=Halalkalibacter oceani TaxID=1653776 RepID=A0A9X2INX2_9BACI|nr:UbiD family decarboxylase [Halalkalibacter oceani]MCM3713827.1 UbiD family decarboxylase [Halalkalibacter oceani]